MTTKIDYIKNNVFLFDLLWKCFVFDEKVWYMLQNLDIVLPFFQNNKICMRILLNKLHWQIMQTENNLNTHQNDGKWKFPFIFVLRFVKQMFSFWSFWDFCFQFVSSAYSHNKTILCISHLHGINRIWRRRSWWW